MGSVTVRLHDIEAGVGREEAVAFLWERFSEDLTRHAVKKLRGMRAARGGRLAQGVIDEEDAAGWAFARICLAIEAGKLEVANRTGLVKLLLKTTERGLKNQIERESRIKRGGREVIVYGSEDSPDPEGPGLGNEPGGGPDPRDLVEAEEGCRRLLAVLGDERLRRVAVLKFMGYTNKEVAEMVGLAPPTVERCLGRIRALWAGELPGVTAKCGRRGWSAAPPAGQTGPAEATGDAPPMCDFTDLPSIVALLVGKAMVGIECPA